MLATEFPARDSEVLKTKHIKTKQNSPTPQTTTTTTTTTNHTTPPPRNNNKQTNKTTKHPPKTKNKNKKQKQTNKKHSNNNSKQTQNKKQTTRWLYIDFIRFFFLWTPSLTLILLAHYHVVCSFPVFQFDVTKMSLTSRTEHQKPQFCVLFTEEMHVDYNYCFHRLFHLDKS